MDYDRLWTVADKARAGKRLKPDEAIFIGNRLPIDLADFPDIDLPKSIRHPGGFSVSGAPVGTFLRSALLLAGHKVFGKRYDRSPFYQAIERDLAFGVMRSNFHNGHPKGAFCCSQCTLAVYPVLDSGGIRYFDCAELADGVRALVEGRKWRFATPPNPKMLAWSMGA
ncbi:MAG TPA: hypothetical protein VG942_06810 [Hyphomonadaceae bacterium]|nr:hypothetical protein [Hyphomonadaceae bacterium]